MALNIVNTGIPENEIKPGAAIKAIIADPADSVVTLTCRAEKSEEIAYFSGKEILSVKASEPVPEYHKLAVADIEKGRPVIKYGETIGFARIDIHKGDWVHTHNLSSDGR